MFPLSFLRSRDTIGAATALLVLAAIVVHPARDIIRMKDAARPITISLAPPIDEARPEPVAPVLPPPRAPAPKTVLPHHAPVPHITRPEPGPVAEPIVALATQPVSAQPVAPATSPPAPPAPPAPAARPQAPAQPSAPAPASIEAAYVAKLRAYLESIKRYPTTREARSMRPQGSVRVWLEIDRGGAVHGTGIGASSGSMILDAAALATVRQGNYPPFPEQTWDGQSMHRFEVTLEYSLAG